MKQATYIRIYIIDIDFVYMKKLIWLYCLLFIQTANAQILNDTADGFKQAVTNACQKAGFASNDDLQEAIQDNAERFNSDRACDEGDISKEKCHVVVAMLATLLSSGNRDLVQLHYYIINSYWANPDFLKQTTGFDWDRTGRRQANQHELAVYDASRAMYNFTQHALDGVWHAGSNTHITCFEQAAPPLENNIPWLDKQDDAWHLHSWWADVLVFPTYYGHNHFETTSPRDIPTVYRKDSQGRLLWEQNGNGRLQTEQDYLKYKEECTKNRLEMGSFWFGTLISPLNRYFEAVMPDYIVRLNPLPMLRNTDKYDSKRKLPERIWNMLWNAINEEEGDQFFPGIVEELEKIEQSVVMPKFRGEHPTISKSDFTHYLVMNVEQHQAAGWRLIIHIHTDPSGEKGLALAERIGKAMRLLESSESESSKSLSSLFHSFIGGYLSTQEMDDIIPLKPLSSETVLEIEQYITTVQNNPHHIVPPLTITLEDDDGGVQGRGLSEYVHTFLLQMDPAGAFKKWKNIKEKYAHGGTISALQAIELKESLTKQPDSDEDDDMDMGLFD